jgi:hypothetical protein
MLRLAALALDHLAGRVDLDLQRLAVLDDLPL